jgi:hypothetical protein
MGIFQCQCLVIDSVFEKLPMFSAFYSTADPRDNFKVSTAESLLFNLKFKLQVVVELLCGTLSPIKDI